MKKKLTMSVLEDTYSICRLEAASAIPDWALNSNFVSITRTMEELSIVCCQKYIPADIPDDIQCIQHVGGWKALKVEGPLDFGLTGILSGISKVLADKEISIFAVSTYDTDYILIRKEKLEMAVQALLDEEFEVLY